MKVRFDREVWIAAFFAALPAQSVAQSAPETRTRIPVDQPLVDPDLKGAPWVAPPKEGSLPSDRSALTLEERQQAVRELDEQRFPMRTGVPAVSDKEGAAPDTSNMRSGVDARTFYQLETAADGTVWAIGGTYKASFGPEGASYVPFLGSDAPQNYPLNLHLESVTLEGENLLFDAAAWPVLEGNSAVYRRGTFEERYATAVGSIEQTFVFDRLPARGELRVRMGVESELQPGSAAEGLVFSNDRGSVTYSNAVAFDARGRAVEAPTTFVDGSIEIRVPEAFVAGATLPITIDPIVATYSPSVSTNLDYNADISWDDSNSRFMICWERAFSLTDHDVWAEMFTALGAPIAGSGAYIDFTTQSWTLPKCANNRFQGQFLVAAVVTSSTPSEIWARTREAENLTMSAPIQVSAFTGNKKWVDVGGDRFLGSNAYYCVVWEREYNPGIDHDIHAQLMNTSGALEGTSIMVDNTSGTFDKYPSISNGNDAHTWTVAWNR